MATITPPSKRPPIVNLPNILTAARFVLALVLFVLVGLYEVIGPATWLWCLGLFVAASVNDYVDGYYASKLGLPSSVCSNLVSVVYKVLICGVFTFLLDVPGSELAPW